MVENGGSPKGEKRNLIIILATLLVLMITLIALVAANLLGGRNGGETGDVGETEYSDQEAEDFARQELVDESLKDTPVDQYIAEAEAKIEETTDTGEKALLHSDLAEEIYSRPEGESEQYIEKIRYHIYQAEELAHSAETAWAIYNFETIFGNESQAKIYLDLAKERGFNPEEGQG